MRRAGVDRVVTMTITGYSVRDMNEAYNVVEDWEGLEAVRTLETYRAANLDHSLDQEKVTN